MAGDDGESMKVQKPERFFACGLLAVFILVLFSLSYVAWFAPRDFVGYAGSGSLTPIVQPVTSVPSPQCTLGAGGTTLFSVAPIQGGTTLCRNQISSGSFFCPEPVFIQACMDDGGNAVLNYCAHGYCGNKVLEMTFEQSPFVDTSGAGNAVSCSTCPQQTAVGRRGKGALVDGKFIDVPTLGTFMTPTFTVLMWVKPLSALGSGQRTIIGNKNLVQGTLQGYSLTISGPTVPFTSGSIALASESGPVSHRAATAQNIITFDDWNHVAAVVDVIAGTAQIYRNGVDMRASGSVLQSLTALTGTWRIGTFDGELDEVRIVPRLLSEFEIKRDMARAFSCGNGFFEGTALGGIEECDDGATVDGDGCSATCIVEQGFSCTGASGATSVCNPTTCTSAQFCVDNNFGNSCVAGTCVNECVDLDGASEESLFIQSGTAPTIDYCSDLRLYFDEGDTTSRLPEGNLLVEFACGVGEQTYYVIGGACKDGALIDETHGIPFVGCYDTDNGNNPTEQGTARVNKQGTVPEYNDGVWHTDYCFYDGTGPFLDPTGNNGRFNKLREFYCDASGEIMNGFVGCPNGCSNGGRKP